MALANDDLGPLEVFMRIERWRRLTMVVWLLAGVGLFVVALALGIVLGGTGGLAWARIVFLAGEAGLVAAVGSGLGWGICRLTVVMWAERAA